MRNLRVQSRAASLMLALVFATGFLFIGSSIARDFTKEECPVIGNTDSKIYHVPGGLNYNMMLRENKDKSRDNRKCFKTEEAARKAGYRKARNSPN